MSRHLSNFLRNESGATSIEYGLIAGFIAIVIITAVARVGTNLRGKFNVAANGLS